MKGIMFINFLKLYSVLYFCVHLASAAKEKDDNTTTTTTTTTAKPFDLSGVETRHFENSVPILHPGESLSRSHSLSYSRSTQHYDQQNPDYKGKISEHSKEQHYDDNGENSYHNLRQEQAHIPQAIDYFKLHEARQQYHENSKEQEEQKNKYSHPDHNGKDQTTYGYHESYGLHKDENYGSDRPLFHYAYEIDSDPQHQQHYDLAEIQNSDEKSTYGSSESEEYDSKSQQAEYYPKPKATRYILEDAHEKDYRSEGKESYFPDIPKEAGYATNVQKEHGYLQISQKEPSYSKEAGYSPRNNEPSAFSPILPKGKSEGSSSNGKVAVYIKHLGHKTPGTNQYVTKERQGFLLLPILRQKMEDKYKELSGKPSQEYQHNKQANYRLSPVKKQEHVQSKVIHYPVNAKVASIRHAPAYSLEEGHAKQPVKVTVSHGNYHIVRHPIKHTAENTDYKNAEAYAEDDKSDARPAPYIPQTVSEYGKQSGGKTYSAGALEYGGHHHVIPSLTANTKSEQASLYAKEPEFTPPYGFTTVHKPASIKVKDFHPSSFSSIYHAQGYPRIVDLSQTASKNKKSTSVSSHSYGTSAGESPQYQNPALKVSTDNEKSFLEFVHKPYGPEIAGFRPSSYTSRGRVSARGLVESFGLHDYESLLSKPSHGGSDYYYDLHSFPAEHVFTRFHYPRSSIPAKLML